MCKWISISQTCFAPGSTAFAFFFFPDIFSFFHLLIKCLFLTNLLLIFLPAHFFFVLYLLLLPLALFLSAHARVLLNQTWVFYLMCRKT